MGKTKTIFNWFKKRKATGIFTLAAFVGGFMFLNRTLTGNVIAEETYYFDLLSLIGLLLIVCALILAFYTVKRKR